MALNNEIIVIGLIENTGEGFDKIGLLTVKFVSYPDCQQLIVWLPQDGYHGYGDYRLIEDVSNSTIDRDTIQNRLNGNVQLLIDTIELPAREYRIEIDNPVGGSHVVHFQKFEEGMMPLRSEYSTGVINPNGENESTETKAESVNSDQYQDKKAVTPSSQLSAVEMQIESELFASGIRNENLKTEILNASLSLATEWGENYQKSIVARMIVRFPSLSEPDILLLEKYVREVESFIYRLASQFIDGEIREEEVIIKAKQRYTWLNDYNASRLAGIGKYYASR